MTKSIIILVVHILGAINVVELVYDAGETETSQEPSNTDLRSVELLAEIERKDVLPLIIFINPTKYQYQYRMPEKLVKFKLNDGKIAYGTEFWPREPGDQTFLCPRENSEEKCLVRQSFEGLEHLKCSSELTPDWKNTYDECGSDGMGTIFVSVYKICDTEANEFDPSFVFFYEICYNTHSNDVLYTSHEIMSWRLLNSNFLSRERSVDYAQTEETTNLKKGSYQMQQLVPHADMAFATWRKTTFNGWNYEWQHEKLIRLWDEINQNIKSTVKKYVTSGELKFYVNTAVVDINSTSNDEEQLSNIWMKMVFIKKSNFIGSKLTHGIVILMNNFLHENKSSDSKKEAIDEYCELDLCIDELTYKFTLIGGRIRCCSFNPDILKVFGYEMEEVEELRIPNVTVTPDQETLYETISLERAAESLRKIQPNEMLPLILLLDHNLIPALQPPKGIVKIETKHRRMVQGSDFTQRIIADQIFFCPKEDSDEKCLSAKEFGRFEPLQCAKEATPVIREIAGKDGECGFRNTGTFYEIIYEICPMVEPYHHESDHIQFYKVCYDKEKERNLFTYHRIISPNFLFLNLMLREHDLQNFIMMTDNSVPVSTAQDEESKSGYTLQQLVPSGDMAFGSWKKTTHQRINFDWQHEKLIPLWNKINSYIRAHTFLQEQNPITEISPLFGFTRSYDKYQKKYSDQVFTDVQTGVFDIKYESEDPTATDDQKSNIWVKIVRTQRGLTRQEVAILMNNFLVADQGSSTSLISKRDVIQTYCEKSSCLDFLEKKFEDIGGRIRCCPVTPEIAQLFGKQGNDFYERVLPIHNITKGENSRVERADLKSQVQS